MSDLMFWNDVFVIGCLIGAGLSFRIALKKYKGPTFSANDVRNDIRKDRRSEIKKLYKQHKKALKAATKRA